MDEWTLIQEIASNVSNVPCNGTWNKKKYHHTNNDICVAIYGISCSKVLSEKVI